MVKNIILAWAIATLFVFPGSALGHPPSDMRINYDSQTGVLLVEVKHITTTRNHHLRKLVVYKNGEEQTKFTIVKQTTPSTMIQEIPLKTVPGDTIRVSVLCNEGGNEERTLVIESQPPLNENSSK